METIPVEETTRRVAELQERLASVDIGLALIRQPVDLFYYTGTVMDGFLAVPAAGQPLLLVRRPQIRSAEAEFSWPLTFYKSLNEISSLLAEAGFKPLGAIGLELDVLPTAFFHRLHENIFPKQPVKDLSIFIRRQRMIKSAYEIEQLRRAAAIHDKAYGMASELLKPGVTELEVVAAIEYHLRRLGHQGLIRVRNPNLEVFYGHLLSGVSGLQAAYTDTHSGGLGINSAYPQGASLRKMAPGEPISIDIASCVNGYVTDMTRMFAMESLPDLAWEAMDLVTELYRIFQAEARPGVLPGTLYKRLWNVVKAEGFEDNFMGLGPDRVTFLAHGVGLEMDEYPLLSARFPYPLEVDMVLAFEPKFFLPGIGMIGLEDTGRITSTGVEWLHP